MTDKDELEKARATLARAELAAIEVAEAATKNYVTAMQSVADMLPSGAGFPSQITALAQRQIANANSVLNNELAGIKNHYKDLTP